MSKIYSIYLIRNLLNDKCYIGWSVNPEKRWGKHINISKGITKTPPFYIHRAINKYGKENFQFSVIYSSEDVDHIKNEMEPYFISLFDSKENGYNLTEGGDGTIGWVPPETTRQIWREQRAGRKLTQEWKDKIGEASRKNPAMANEDTRRKVSLTLKERGIRPIVSKEKREEMRINKIGKPIHTKEHKQKLSERLKKNNPMREKDVIERARKNKTGKGVGKRNGRAVFAKVFDPKGNFVSSGHLKRMCEECCWPYSKFLRNSRSHESLERGAWKGWNILRIEQPPLEER